MKKVFFYLIIGFIVSSCNNSGAEKVSDVQVKELNQVELYNKFINENTDSCILFKEDYEFCKNYVQNSKWQTDIKDTLESKLTLRLISFYSKEKQNAIFLRYELMDSLTPIQVTFRSGDFDFTMDVDLICNYLDSTEIANIEMYVLNYHLKERLHKVLRTKYIVIAKNLEYKEIKVEDNATYTGGFLKEVIYVFGREEKKLLHAFVYENTVEEKVSYEVAEGAGQKDALASALYESFQNSNSFKINRSFDANKVWVVLPDGDQFRFNYGKRN